MNRRDFLSFTSGALAMLAGSNLLSRAGAPATVPAQPLADDLAELPEMPLAGSPRGPWRRLFLDAAAVEASSGVTRVFHSAEKHPGNPVLRADQPWETTGPVSGPYVYGTVFWREGKLALWYQVLNKGNHVGYAESRDGLTWTKPALGLIEYNGSKANNLVVSAFQPEATGGNCHNPGVLRCPGETNPDRKYALYGYDGTVGHARVAFSPDGLRWSYPAESAQTPLFTSSDVVNFFYDPYEGRYTATWKTRNRRGRAVGVAWSRDGVTWTKPLDGPVFTADDLDPDATQIYGMPAFPYQGLYIGQPWIYRARYFKYGRYSVKKMHEAQADSRRTMEVQLAWSWDMINWTRPPERNEFIPLGAPGEWDDGMIYTARAPVIVGDKLHFYYGGCDGFHDDKRVKASIGLATLRLDGFCSLRAHGGEGWLVSRREPFREPVVLINGRTRGDGAIVAEIIDRKNQVVPGFSRDDCVAFRGDAVAHELRWKADRLPPSPTGDWKIRFWLRDAELFSYLPRGLAPGEPDLARFQKDGP